MNSLGGRKFMLSVLALLLTTGLLIYKIEIKAEFVTLFLGIIGSFTVGNSISNLNRREAKLVGPEVNKPIESNKSIDENEVLVIDNIEGPLDITDKIDKLTENMLALSSVVMAIKEDTSKVLTIIAKAAAEDRRKL